MRRRAADRRLSLSQLVCEAVSAYLNEAPSRGAEPPFELATCGDAGGYAPSPAEMSEERLDEARIGSPAATGRVRAARGDVLAPDVNVLVYAHRAESPEHARYGAWLKRLAEETEPFGLPDLVGASFVRIVTNARLWRRPTPPRQAIELVERLRFRRGCRVLHAGAASWPIFVRLVDATSATGKLVADAWLAALVMEHACTLVTCDSDFARFPDLRWMHPLQPAE